MNKVTINILHWLIPVCTIFLLCQGLSPTPEAGNQAWPQTCQNTTCIHTETALINTTLPYTSAQTTSLTEYTFKGIFYSSITPAWPWKFMGPTMSTWSAVFWWRYTTKPRPSEKSMQDMQQTSSMDSSTPSLFQLFLWYTH